MSDLEFMWPEMGRDIIFGTAFFTDEKCSVAPYGDTWGLQAFKEMSSYYAMSFDTKLSYQKYINAGTPYIAGMSDREILIVKQAAASDQMSAETAFDDKLWKLSYTPVAEDKICVMFADSKYIGFNIADGIWIEKPDNEATTDYNEAETAKEDDYAATTDYAEEDEYDVTAGAKSMGAAFTAAALAVAATHF